MRSVLFLCLINSINLVCPRQVLAAVGSPETETIDNTIFLNDLGEKVLHTYRNARFLKFHGTVTIEAPHSEHRSHIHYEVVMALEGRFQLLVFSNETLVAKIASDGQTIFEIDYLRREWTRYMKPLFSGTDDVRISPSAAVPSWCLFGSLIYSWVNDSRSIRNYIFHRVGGQSKSDVREESREWKELIEFQDKALSLKRKISEGKIVGYETMNNSDNVIVESLENRYWIDLGSGLLVKREMRFSDLPSTWDSRSWTFEDYQYLDFRGTGLDFFSPVPPLGFQEVAFEYDAQQFQWIKRPATMARRNKGVLK